MLRCISLTFQIEMKTSDHGIDSDPYSVIGARLVCTAFRAAKCDTLSLLHIL